MDGEIQADQMKPVPHKGIRLIGGAGTFTFSKQSTVCLDIGAGKAPGTLHTGLLAGSGTYKQRLVLPNGQKIDTPCGWSKVMGIITRQNVHPKFDAILNRKFAIEFGPLIGKGAFFWHHQVPNKPPIDKNPPLPKLQPDPDEGGKINPYGTKAYRYAGDVQVGASTQSAANELAKRLENSDPEKCSRWFHVNAAVVVHEA
jgi:hypothetical protein